LFDKALANPNYILVYMKVYYFFILCLFKVGRQFSKLAIPKYMVVFVIKISKENTYFMYGWTWEIEHKMYCLLLTWVYVWNSSPYFHSRVSNINFDIWIVLGPYTYPMKNYRRTVKVFATRGIARAFNWLMCLGGIMHFEPTSGCQISTLIFEKNCGGGSL
jgi:hypothetical protein